MKTFFNSDKRITGLLRLIFLYLFVLLTGLHLLTCKKKRPEDPNPALPSEPVPVLDLQFIDTQLPHQFMGVHFVNDSTGYMVSYQAGIFKTTNGGLTWTEQESNTKMPLYDVQFLNENLGFAAGGTQECGFTTCKKGGVVLKTTNGGNTWEVTSAATEFTELVTVHFIDDSVGFAAGLGTLLATRDQGMTWKKVILENFSGGGGLLDIQFSDKKNGLIACGSGGFFRTKDGGKNWALTNPSQDNTISGSSFSFVNLHTVYFAGFQSGYGTFKSKDFASTWKKISNQPEDIFHLLFVNEKVGYAFGSGKWSGGDFGREYGSIFCTINGGKTWVGNDTIKETGVIWNAHFPREDLGYAVSNNMVIKVRRR